MATAKDIVFADDARWNAERECVEVTAIVRLGGGERRIPCAIAREALEHLVRLPSPADPLRLFRDFESALGQIVARKVGPATPEIAVTRRDVAAS